MMSHHFPLCKTQPFCLSCPHFILLPFSIFYLFFQIVTLHYICTLRQHYVGGMEEMNKKEVRKWNWQLFCMARTSGLALQHYKANLWHFWLVEALSARFCACQFDRWLRSHRQILCDICEWNLDTIRVTQTSLHQNHLCDQCGYRETKAMG